jgi:hypothetical protein
MSPVSGKGRRAFPPGRGRPGCRRAGQPLQVWLLNTHPVGLTVLPLAVK